MSELGGSHGLVVMGRGSKSEGRKFESQYRILDGHFSPSIFVKKENENKREEAEDGHLKKCV